MPWYEVNRYSGTAYHGRLLHTYVPFKFKCARQCFLLPPSFVVIVSILTVTFLSACVSPLPRGGRHASWHVSAHSQAGAPGEDRRLGSSLPTQCGSLVMVVGWGEGFTHPDLSL